MEIIVFLTAGSLLLIIVNSFTIKVVRDEPSEFAKSVSILVPMRNEETNVRGCIESLQNQEGLKNFEILILDDNSTDNTLGEIRKFGNITIIEGKPIPPNWLGKLWACHQLSQQSTGEFLVFVDADVRLSKHAISAALNTMQGWSFISPYPKQLTSGLLQRLFQPLLQWSWLASVPLFWIYKFPNKKMAIANGQFLIIERSAYEKSGGHEKIQSEVLDDLMLARNLIGCGFKGAVVEASQIAVCKMYNTSRELIVGYQKSLYKAFGTLPGAVIALSLLVFTGIVPLIAVINGSTLGLLAFIFIFVGRVITSLRTSSIPNTAILHPLAIAALIIIFLYSLYGRVTNTLTWRSRLING